MFQPQDPNIWTSGNRTVENLVSRGGGMTWNPEKNQYERFWKQETYRDPNTGGMFVFDPVLNDWFQLMNSGVINMREEKKKKLGNQIGESTPENNTVDFMSMFAPYITGDHLRR